MLTPRKFDLLDKLLAREPLRLPPTPRAGLSVVSGVVEVPFPGANPESEAVEVPHGLGATPSRIWFAAFGNGGIRFCTPESSAPGETKFTVRCFCPYGSPSAGQKAKFYWFAMP